MAAVEKAKVWVTAHWKQYFISFRTPSGEYFLPDESLIVLKKACSCGDQLSLEDFKKMVAENANGKVTFTPLRSLKEEINKRCSSLTEKLQQMNDTESFLQLFGLEVFNWQNLKNFEAEMVSLLLTD